MRSHFRSLLCVFLFLFSLGSFPVQAQTRSIISNLANPAIGFNALFKAQVAPDLDQPYGIEFEEAEISLISTVDPYWTLAANLVFAPDGVDPEEVYATSSSIPGIGLKVGKIRGSFGKHGLLHTHAFPFIQAPVIMANTIGEEGFKDAGIEAAWLTPLPWFCELTLGGYHAVGPDTDHPLDFGSSNHDNIPYLGHLKNLFDVDDNTTLELGGSFLGGYGADGLHHSAYGADLTLRNVPLRQSNQQGWILQSELLARDSWNNDGSFASHDAIGWYASLQYRWSQVWWTGIRVEEAFNSFSDVMVSKDPATGLPNLDSNGNAIPVAGHVQCLSANIAWAASEFSMIRLEYSGARETPDDESGTVWDNRIMAQMNFTIGFHPPHAY
ncbi:MAG TPA: hypothetical protein VMV05_08100 [bacterium]|nr:hypothetical protein [bacterium]